MTPDRRIPTLYLTRTGLLEPLGQSQVMAYLRGLADDYRITLVTAEKEADLADTAAVARARAECDSLGIRWRAERFRSRPRLLAPAWGLARLAGIALREARAGRVRLVHARSYLPAAVALAVKRWTGVPFVFDMRALWPEERITAGRLKRGGSVHRALVQLERACLAEAAGVVSLTEAAVDHLRGVYPRELAGQHVVVIPTCVDLDRFVPAAARAPGPVVHGCAGTVLSGWFLTDWLAAWFDAVAAHDPAARFQVLTRDDPARVRQRLDGAGRLGGRLSIVARRPEEMPEALRGQDVSAMFYAGGQVSELGRSPTRLGEVLACGLPVVVNAGVGDVARLVSAHRVGVVVAGPSPEAMAAACDALAALRSDPGLAARCRGVAEAVFSLDGGIAAYRRLYADILGPAGAAR